MSESDLGAPDPRDALSRVILGGDPTYTNDEVAELTGMDVEEADRLWRALGFPDSGGSRAFVDADLDALRTVHQAVESGVLDRVTAMRLTRALGNTMSRLADWQVSTLAELVEGRVEDGSSSSRLGSGLDLVRQVGPAFERLLVYAWRRHLAAALVRVEALGAADEDLLHQVLTVGFVDLVSFTALSNGIDDAALGDLVEGFESRCADLVTAGGGRPIKTLGDAVLFVAESPQAAVEIAFAVIEGIGRDSSLPDVRVGLATGPVISRLGDVYGPPVNLAARLTSVARRNRTITDQPTADRLDEGFEWRTLPPRPLHGFGNIEPIAVRRAWAYEG
ncbi:adenylate/guanylate cyclase domain-containing protein [Solicola sp. PLA-1-18]|uniref:adenylate/guanylate cyclase domain-containing protein n=1 Tax=Solicola sp. PLA-1-18 TaxID=3380532 RepID=UPI003B81B838